MILKLLLILIVVGILVLAVSRLVTGLYAAGR